MKTYLRGDLRLKDQAKNFEILFLRGFKRPAREGFKKKDVKFGLLAEISWGRGLRGVQEPNLLLGIFLIV